MNEPSEFLARPEFIPIAPLTYVQQSKKDYPELEELLIKYGAYDSMEEYETDSDNPGDWDD